MKKQINLLIIFCLLAMGATAFISFNLGSLHALDNQIIYGAGNTFYSDYEGQTNTYHYEGNAVTVESVVNLMSEPWQNLVIIKNEKVVYSGLASDYDKHYHDYKVTEIANTEDSSDNSSITLIIE